MTTITHSLKHAILSVGLFGVASCGTPDSHSTQQADGMAPLIIDHETLPVNGLRTPPGTLSLPYVHYHRVNQGRVRPTVFFLGGGPGVSNIKNKPPEQWLNDFDAVVLEYRGVGSSSIVLNSPHFTKGLLEFGEEPASKQFAGLRKAYKKGFADLAQQGVDFTEFSIDALADDVERLRVHLNLDQIYLVGHSFGTRVALSYQSRYRQRAAASILFSMNTPGGMLWYPDDTQRVWTRYAEALAKTNSEQAEKIQRLMHKPNQFPSRYGILPVNNSKALLIAFFLSFNGSTRDSAFNAMASAQDGSGGAWYLLSLSYGMFVRFGFNWADFFLKGYNSDCDRDALGKIAEQGKNAMFQSPSSALFAGADEFEAAGGSCKQSGFVTDYRNTLAVMGEFDPSTPIERKPKEFPDEMFMVLKNAGHADVFYSNQGSTTAWLQKFFLHPDQARPPVDIPEAANKAGKPPTSP